MAPDRVTRSDPEPRRLFVGIAMPVSVTPTIEAAIAPWRERFTNVEWVAAPDRHVTLKFLGPISRQMDGWLHDRIREVAASSHPFELHLAELGAFPSNRQARVLWIGLGDADGHLAALASALEVKLAMELGSERRPFAPHLTVGRSDRPVVVPSGSTASQVTSDVFPVREITLFRSHTGRAAPRYEALEAFPLG